MSDGGLDASQPARRLQNDGGFTLVELLVAMVISLIVFGGVVTFLVVTFRQQNVISSRTAASRQAEAGLQQLVRDLGEAMTTVTISDPTSASTQLVLDIPTPGSDSTPEQVTWICPSAAAPLTNIGSCTRQLGGTTTTAISGVQSLALTNVNGSALTLPASDPAYLGLTLTVQDISQEAPGTIVQGENSGATTPSTNPIMIQTGVDLRNFS
jgi:prepilin-type N-terminal cleavage/methylation domain-containing protein